MENVIRVIADSIKTKVGDEPKETRNVDRVIIKGKDKYIITDNEFVHSINNYDEPVELYLYDVTYINDNGNKSIPLIPTHKVKYDVDEFVDVVKENNGEVKDEVDFREWGHYFGLAGHRVGGNYYIFMESCKEIGRDDIEFPKWK